MRLRGNAETVAFTLFWTFHAAGAAFAGGLCAALVQAAFSLASASLLVELVLWTGSRR